jgi:hypothetical protein
MSHYNLGITNQNYRAKMRGEEITNEMCGCGCGKTTARCELDRRIAEFAEQRRQEQERQAAEIALDNEWLNFMDANEAPEDFMDEVSAQQADDDDNHRTMYEAAY